MLHHTVIDRWGTDIVSGVLPTGHRIGTDDAATHFGVSRTVVREAVRVLESMGLLSVRQRLGITVTAPARWNPFDPNISRWRLEGPAAASHLRHLTELRTANEPFAAERAASSATTEQIQALEPAVVGMSTSSRSDDKVGYAGHDADFHRTLLAASDNPLLIGLAGLIGHALQRPAAVEILCPPELIGLHGAVAAAIRSGDAVAGERAARAILGAHPPLPETHQLPVSGQGRTVTASA